MNSSKRLILFLLLISLITCSTISAGDTGVDTIKLKINNSTMDVKLENNPATSELIEKLKDGNITIKAVDYGNFEKVGDLGFSLPTRDKKIETSPGDVVLYQGNQISLFYDSHSWPYTKIGKIENKSQDELKEILGSGDVELEFSLE